MPRRRALPISTMSYTLSLAYEKLFEMPILSNLYPGASSFLQMIRNGSQHSETKETGGSITDDDKGGKDEDKGSESGQVGILVCLQLVYRVRLCSTVDDIQ